MRLTDISPVIEKYDPFESYTDYDCDFDAGIFVVVDMLKNLPIIDPIHAANTCYCKECWYYTEWGECKEFGEIMKPDEFCSRGVMKNDKTY